MAVDLDKLGELIDGYGGIAADDLNALPQNAVDCQYATAENVILRYENVLLRSENARLRDALAEVELILTGLSGGIADDGCILGRAA